MRPLLFLALLAPSAYGFSFGDIVSWTGSGANRAALVVDFQDGRGALAWGYRFDGSRNGLAMISDIATATELDIQITSFSFGDAVTGIRFRDRSRGGFDPGSSGYFSYLTRDAGTTEPSWAFADESAVGASDRSLADGSWDAWSWYANFTPALPSGTTAAPVPEPATLLGLAIGAGLLRRRRVR